MQFQIKPYIILISAVYCTRADSEQHWTEQCKQFISLLFGINFISPSLGLHIHSLCQTSIPYSFPELLNDTSINLTISQIKIRINRKKKKKENPRLFHPFTSKLICFPHFILLSSSSYLSSSSESAERITFASLYWDQ